MLRFEAMFTMIFVSSLTIAQPGLFQFNLTSDSLTTGALDETLFAYAELRNDSPFEVQLLMIRQVNEMPSGWGSAICTDVCQAPEVDTALQVLQPNTTQEFIMYFYTSEIPDTGYTRMEFVNLENPENRFIQGFRGITSKSVSLEPVSGEHFILSVGPNPFEEEVSFLFTGSRIPDNQLLCLDVYNPEGKKAIPTAVINKSVFTIKRNNLARGTYFYIISNNRGILATGQLLAR